MDPIIYDPKTAFGNKDLIENGRFEELREAAKKAVAECDECDDEGMAEGECPTCGHEGYRERCELHPHPDQYRPRKVIGPEERL